MEDSTTCRDCGLQITALRQLSQEDIDKISEHKETYMICECCLIAALGQIEYPD